MDLVMHYRCEPSSLEFGCFMQAILASHMAINVYLSSL